MIYMHMHLPYVFLQEKFQTALTYTTVFAKFHAQILKIIAEKEIIFMKLAENVDRK